MQGKGGKAKGERGGWVPQIKSLLRQFSELTDRLSSHCWNVLRSSVRDGSDAGRVEGRPGPFPSQLTVVKRFRTISVR
jgi:hypothetical protein